MHLRARAGCSLLAGINPAKYRTHRRTNPEFLTDAGQAPRVLVVGDLPATGRDLAESQAVRRLAEQPLDDHGRVFHMVRHPHPMLAALSARPWRRAGSPARGAAADPVSRILGRLRVVMSLGWLFAARLTALPATARGSDSLRRSPGCKRLPRRLS
eukprot:scaffold2502_cov362-Prasinococcus_capsulatus_cf.AAC.1